MTHPDRPVIALVGDGAMQMASSQTPATRSGSSTRMPFRPVSRASLYTSTIGS